MRRITVASLALLFCLTVCTSLWAGEAQYNVGIIVVKQKSLADNLRQRILKGESFEKLAQENSIGPNARRGGRLGMVPAGKLRNEYRQALSSLQPGKVSNVIAVEEGYTLLTVFPPERAASPPPVSATSSAPQHSAVPPVATAGAATAGAATGETLRFMVEPTTAEAVNVGLLTEVLNGLEFMQKNEIKRAEDAFQKALTYDANDDSSQLLLGMVQESLAGKYHPKVMAQMADAFMAMLQGEGVKAYEMFLKLGKENPTFWQAKLMEGTMLMDAQQFDQALATLQEVTQIKPDYARTYLVIGNIYYYQLKGQEAEAAYVKGLQLDPDLADGYYFLGRLYWGYGEVEFAEQEYKRAIELNPMLYDAYNDLGSIYMYANRINEAVEYFHRALTVNPGMVPAMINLGILYANQKQMDKALEWLQKAVDMPVIMPAANYNFGLVLMELKQWDKAEEQINLAGGAGYPVPEAVYQMLKERRTQ